MQKGKKITHCKAGPESPNGTCTSPSHRHRPHNTHLGTLSRLPTQTCWGGTIFHFLASTTIASASTSPKPYRWLTGKREDSETLSLPAGIRSSSSVLGGASSNHQGRCGVEVLGYEVFQHMQLITLVTKLHPKSTLAPGKPIARSSPRKVGRNCSSRESPPNKFSMNSKHLTS